MRAERHLIVVENFGQVALEVTDVGLKSVVLSHFDGEKVMLVLLGL